MSDPASGVTTVIRLDFPAGRYHTTPWGRNVNEGEAEWPPSVMRLLRALVDTWKRKMSELPEQRVADLLGTLASVAPGFAVPPACPSHTRSFLHQNKQDQSDRKLVFDPFMVVNPSDSVFIIWPGLELTHSQRADLVGLLDRLNFLGRSESWVRAALVNLPDGEAEPNCIPAESAGQHERIDVHLAVSPEAFRGMDFLTSVLKGMKVGPLEIDDPWLRALCVSTSDIQAGGLSGHPLLRRVSYQITRARTPELGQRRPLHRTSVQAVLYALEGTVRPLATETLVVAERVRVRLMGIHRRIVGAKDRVSPRFSGKDHQGAPLQGHLHSHYLPLDLDGDSRLDHLLVWSGQGYEDTDIAALDRLAEVHLGRGRPPLRTIPVFTGGLSGLARCSRAFEPSTRMVSVTPFIATHHYRRGRGSFEDWNAGQLGRECSLRALPIPASVNHLGHARCWGTGPQLFWTDFQRVREGDEARAASGFELIFSEPVAPPLCLGYAAHFGLGLFLAPL